MTGSGAGFDGEASSAADAGSSEGDASSGADMGEATTVGQTASGSECGATPTQIVDFSVLANQVHAGSISAMPLAVDGANVYFVFGDRLMRVPLRGGLVATMLDLSTVPSLLLIDLDADLLVTSTDVILHYPQSLDANEQILSVPIQGGSATSLATSNGGIAGFATDGHDIYFADQQGIESVAATGGTLQLLASGSAGFGSLAVIGSNIIATSGAQGGAVLAVPLQGGPTTTLATQQPNASFPMLCGTDICWWTGATPLGAAGSSGPGAVEQIDSNGNMTSLAQAPFFPWSLVFDGTDFFETVACDACDGTLLRIPLTGGPSVSMGSGSFVTVDDSCAYWSTIEGISSASKSYVAASP